MGRCLTDSCCEDAHCSQSQKSPYIRGTERQSNLLGCMEWMHCGQVHTGGRFFMSSSTAAALAPSSPPRNGSRVASETWTAKKLLAWTDEFQVIKRWCFSNRAQKFTDFMSRKPGVFTVLRACFIIFRQAFRHCLAGAVTMIRLLDSDRDSCVTSYPSWDTFCTSTGASAIVADTCTARLHLCACRVSPCLACTVYSESEFAYLAQPTDTYSMQFHLMQASSQVWRGRKTSCCDRSLDGQTMAVAGTDHTVHG